MSELASTPAPIPMPVRCNGDALLLLSMAAKPEPEVLAFLLDRQGLGGVVLAVGNARRPDRVLGVVDVVARAGEQVGGMASLVVASVRPKGAMLPGDAQRWLTASDMCRQHGLVLVEWYVLGRHGPQLPRELVGEPSRWPVSQEPDVAPA